MTPTKRSTLTPVKTPHELLNRLRQARVVSAVAKNPAKPGRPNITITLDIDGEHVACKWPTKMPLLKALGVPNDASFSAESLATLRRLQAAILSKARETTEWQKHEEEQSLRTESRFFSQRVERLVESAVKLGVDPDKFLQELGKYYRERFVESVITS